MKVSRFEMISKELLSQVLNLKVTYVYSTTHTQNETSFEYECISFTVEGGYCKSIPISVLANKCKEWAYAKGYIINTAIEPLTHKMSWQYDLFKLRYEKIDMDMGIPPTQHFIITKSYSTEPEAIFKATQYIKGLIK